MTSTVFSLAEHHFAWASLAVHAMPVDSADTWDSAKAKVLDRLGGLLGIDHERITLCHNTTTAAQRAITRALQVLGPREVVLLTTDLEYPGIIATLDEGWPGPMFMLELEPLVWKGAAATIPEYLRRAFLMTHPDLVYVSHVARGTGYVVPDDVIVAMRESRSRPVFVLDGAQAVGNIEVTKQALASADIYLTSGHKWLGGKATLGIAIADNSVWGLSDPAQAYSRARGSAGSGDVGALAGLARSLAEFGKPEPATLRRAAEETRRLSALLTQRLAQAGTGGPEAIGRQAGWLANGIVAVRATEAMVSALRDASRLDDTVDQSQPPHDKPRITWIERERWRDSKEGGRSRHRRYVVSIADGELVIRDVGASLRKIGTPSPMFPHCPTYLRCCVHGMAHDDDSIRGLADRLNPEARHGSSASAA